MASAERQAHWDKLYQNIVDAVNANPEQVNKREWKRLQELRAKKPDLDMDAYCIMHRTELFTPESQDVAFTDTEFNTIKDELAKYSTVKICEHMEKDETTRDDLKIRVRLPDKSFKVIWYLKIKDIFSGKITYNQLLPKIQKEYSGFDALVADIQDTVLNTENPF